MKGEIKSSNITRRDFLKLLGAGATVVSFTPFVPWGNYMPNPQTDNLQKAKVILSDGTHANLHSFPSNHAEVITYPSTGDAVLDDEAFRKWNIIRLPEELGGLENNVFSFRVYSMICLHLWCLWKYWSDDKMKVGQCPCHASTYDPSTGIAIGGPAAVQAAPSNVLPKLDLESDPEGFLYLLPPTWGINDNGVIGYGRLIKK